MLSTNNRWIPLGDVLAKNCLEVQSGQKVIISQSEIETLRLALASCEFVIKAGEVKVKGITILKEGMLITDKI